MFSRIANLFRGFLSLFIKDLEKRNPEALLELEQENLRKQIASYNQGLANHAGLAERLMGQVRKLETEERELPEAMELFGASQFLFATDYPHDDPGGRMKYKDVQLLRDNPRITEEAKDIIRSTSAAAMLPALT